MNRLDRMSSSVAALGRDLTDLPRPGSLPHAMQELVNGSALWLLALTLPVGVIMAFVGLGMDAWGLFSIPWFVYPLVADLGMVILAVILFIRGSDKARDCGARLYADALYIQKLQEETRKIEAEAKLATARPAVIAEVVRPVPVANPQARTMTDAPGQAKAIPAKPRFLNDTDMPVEDVRWFVHECLTMGRHSRGAWFNRQLSERTAPSGKPLNDIPDYDHYIDLLVKYKIIVNREAGKTGDWIIKDEAEVFQLLGI